MKILLKNKKILFTLIFLITLAFTITTVSASDNPNNNDIFISPEGNGTGTIDNPTNYQTAVKNIKNGTIYFTEGNYTNIVNQTITKSISLSNYNNSKVIIDLGNKGWAFNINKQSTITITGLNFINSNYDSTIHSNNKNINLNLINTSFTNGIAKNGGAINIYAGTLNIINSQFENNIATNDGGAIYIKKGQISLINTNFINNTAQNGGAIAQYNAHSIILNNQFINNTAKYGGALYLKNSSTHTEQTNFQNNNAENAPILFMDGVDTASISETTTIEPATNQTLAGKLFNFIFNTLYKNYLETNSNRSILYNIIYKVANEAIYQLVFGTVDNFIIRAIYDSVFDFVFDSAYNLIYTTVTTPKYVYEVMNYSYIRYSSITQTSGVLINSTGEFDANYNWWGTNTPEKNIYSKTYGLQSPENQVIMELNLENNNAIVTLNKIEYLNGEIIDLDEDYSIPTRTVIFTGENVEFENNEIPIKTIVSNPYTTKAPNYQIEARIDLETIGIETIPEEIDTPETPESPETPETPEEEPKTPETPETPEVPETPEEGEVKTELEIEDLTKEYGNNEALTGKLLAKDGSAIIGHHIDITLTRKSNNQSKTYHVVSDYKGEYTLPINLAAGEYLAEINYEGMTLNDKTYKKINKQINIQINSNPVKTTQFTLNPFTTQYGLGNNFTGRLLDIDENAVIGHHISITLTRLSNGASKVYYATTDFLGEFILPINLARGEYQAICTYDGINNYESTSTETILTVN